MLRDSSEGKFRGVVGEIEKGKCKLSPRTDLYSSAIDVKGEHRTRVESRRQTTSESWSAQSGGNASSLVFEHFVLSFRLLLVLGALLLSISSSLLVESVLVAAVVLVEEERLQEVDGRR
jgi:hypothetical protein